MRSILLLLALVAATFAAPLTGNKITEDGTYTVTTIPGARYVFAVSGDFDGGTLAINWNDGTNSTAYANSPATAAETWTFTAASRTLEFVLTGSTAPDLTVTATQADGSGGTVDNTSVNEALAENPAASIASLNLDIDQTSDLINAQPSVAEKVRSGNVPVRVLITGDSISQFSGGVSLGPNMALSGYFGLLPVSGTESGTITAHGYGVTARRSDYWINGQARTYAAGAQSDFSINGTATGFLRADRASVYYIRQSGGGTFQLQYQSNNTGAWTSLGTIDCSNATQIGAAAVFNLPTTNSPFYKLRIASVTGPCVVIAVNLYNSAGGGVTWSYLGGRGGMDPAEISETPAAIFNPIWTDFAPDVVMGLWADEANEFEDGGGWDLFYDRANAIKTATDWILVSANPNEQSPTRGAGYLYDQQKAQRAWALANRQSFINGYNIFHNYATAQARGWMADTVHPSLSAVAYRNAHLWHILPMGSYNLGGVMLPTPGAEPAFLVSANSSGSVSTTRTMEIRNSTAAIRVPSDTDPLNQGSDWRHRVSADDYLIDKNGGAGLRLSNATNYRGVMPVNNGDELGRVDGTARRFNLNTAGITGLVWAITSANSPYPLDRYIYTATLDATGGNVSATLPAANAAYMTGREYRIKRLASDASSNTATITGTIDGIVNPTLAAGDCWIIQSNGTIWFRIK